MIPATELAHGVGSRGELPLPLWMFSWAASIALVLSFVALGFLWTKPRLARMASGDAIELGRVAGVLILAARIAALALFVTTLVAGFWGADDPSRNLLPVTFYVVVWVGVLIISGLVFDLWSIVNPFVSLVLLIEWASGRVSAVGDGTSGVDARPSPDRSDGAAALGLFVLLYFELVHVSGASPRSIARLLAVHTAVALFAGLRWGSDWLRRYEPFGALCFLIGHLAPMGLERGASGWLLRRRPPMAALGVLSTSLGTILLLMVVLGGTTFDGFSESQAGRSLFRSASGTSGTVVLTAALAASVLAVGVLYLSGCWWVSRVGSQPLVDMLRAFGPSLVPIVFGYAVAHYLQLLIDESQTFVFLLSDPLGRGWNLFGTADGQINFSVLGSSTVAWLQVAAILFGHVGAVAVAHDRSLERFNAKDAWRGQFVMLVVMVAYSTLGLWLLLSA